jgi:hypothetical protein
MGVEDLASRGIEERFLDFADRLLRKSEGGRKSRPAPLGMTVLSGVGRLSGVERLGGVESLGGVGKMRRGWKDAAGFEKRVVPGEHLCRGFFFKCRS